MDTGEAGHHGPAVEVTVRCQEPDCVTILHHRMEALIVHIMVKRKECVEEELVLVTGKIPLNILEIFS